MIHIMVIMCTENCERIYCFSYVLLEVLDGYSIQSRTEQDGLKTWSLCSILLIILRERLQLCFNVRPLEYFSNLFPPRDIYIHIG